MKHIKLYEDFINEANDYAVMLVGGSIGDKPRPRDAKGYAGMDVPKDEWLLTLDNAKAKAKRMNANLSPGEKSHYGLKYVIVPVKGGKFIKESEDVLDEDTLEISGHPYSIWNDKKIQRELNPLKFEIVGQMNGVMTLSGDKKELDKVRAIFGLKESEDYTDLNESALMTAVILLQAAAVAGQFALLSNKLDFHPIDDLKDWWNEHKRDTAVNKILAKLKDDPEVIDFLNLPKNQQEGKWKKLIEPKLSADEIKYLNSVSRDRVRAGKINK
jgi:hypothetical protein